MSRSSWNNGADGSGLVQAAMGVTASSAIVAGADGLTFDRDDEPGVLLVADDRAERAR